jgi:hypothetical protein
MAVQRARICIVSREPFQSAHFVATLHSTLGLEDDLEIIVDRRDSESSGWARLKEDRRRLSEVEVELKANGFAIVPAVEWTDRIDRSRVDGDDRKLEEIRGFLRRRSGPLIAKLVGVLGGVTLAASAALLAWHFSGPSRSSQLSTGSLRSEPDRPPGQSPARREEPAAAAPAPSASADRAPNSQAAAASTRSDSPRDADRITPRPGETSDLHGVSGTASPEAGIAASQPGLPDREVSPAPKETSASPPATRSAAPRAVHDAAAAPPAAATAKATAKHVEKSYRAELVGDPSSRGWGDSYAVRVLDSAGGPVADASVELVARMADGTVENVAMGALTEPGTYRGTVPTNSSTPADLKVRVTSGGESVEVPLSR